MNKEFSTYVAKFMRISAKVPWDERAKLDHLRAGLSHELQQGLAFLDDANTVNELITQVSRLEARQRALQAYSHTTQPWRTTTPQTPSQTTTPQQFYCPPSASTTPHPSFTAGGPVAMDVSGARPCLTQAEKDGRRQRGECYYCGKLVYLAINCPSPSRRPRPLAAKIGELNVFEESGNAESLL